MAHYSGTLAGVRCLAAHGVPVVVATDRLLAPAAWSRAARRKVECPSMADGEAMIEWLLSFGKGAPGMVLHPTCDNLAWLIARYQEELTSEFKLYVPPFSVVETLLDKRRLYEAAACSGIEVPRTWFPSDEADVATIAADHEMLLVKPRWQVFFAQQLRGGLARGADVVSAFRAHRASRYDPIVRASSPDIEFPMLQEYLPAAAQCVYSVSGFVDRKGRLHGVRGAVKVLQQPKRVGVGLCFEKAGVERKVLMALERFCRAVGYFGIFEAEFVPDAERRLLIDFNPRYYGQMGFDIARGAPLPWMLHMSATGHEDLVGAGVLPPECARTGAQAYHDEISVRWWLMLGRIAGTVIPEEARKWQWWLKKHRRAAIDASCSKSDPLPAVVAALGTVCRLALHPRSSLRTLQAHP
jgi:predicted ATP-grasp superfamily ATP-dependent carboligase